MAQFRKALRQPRLVSLAIGLVVFAAIVGARELGVLQSLELFAYDKFLVLRSAPESAANRIAVVEVSEEDIRKYDFPIPDDLLANLIEIISAAHPVAVGLDIFRDVPVPRDGSRLQNLNRVLRENPNVVGIFKFGDSQHPIRVGFPPALKDAPERYGFTDFPFDYGAVRRGFLLLWDDQNNIYTSLSLAVVMQAGVTCKQQGSDFCVGKTVFQRFRSNDGGYVDAQDGGYQFLLDFKSPTKFPIYSLDDVISKRIPPETWKDKIVLIAEGAESAHDFETTPLQTNVPGIELHAQAIDQLLRAAEHGEKPTTSWSEATEIAWILLWCTAGAAIGFFIRKPVILIGIWLALAALILLVCWLSFLRGNWLPLVPPLGGSFLAMALVTTYMRQVERKERETLLRLFSRHLSPDVAQSIWKQRDEFMDGQRPRPQQLTVTVLFTDLRNFSTTTEKLEPSEAMDWINEYMQALAQHVGIHGGVVNKYIGDSIMALFGFPVPRNSNHAIQQDAVNAVTCALKMSDEIRRLNESWTESERPAAQMRVGVFTGRAVAGCVGSEDRLEFTVIGDTVNTASRLESYDKEYAAEDPCRILIGQYTFELLGGRFATQFVQSIELKGKNEKTTIYRVLGGTT
jgi:adenylate cyclase